MLGSIVAFGARGTGHEYLLLSRSWYEQTIYRALGVKLFLCGHGKGRRDRYQQNILRNCPLVREARPVAKRGSCDEPPTKLKPGVGGTGTEGPGPHPPPGPATAAPSASHRSRRRAACPLCRAAPTSSGCRPPRARGRRAGRGGRRFRAASSRRATIRAPSCPPAQRRGRRAAPHRP